jgi:hypothetical protein
LAQIGIELTLLSAFRADENPTFIPCILKYSSDLHINFILVLLLGSLGIGKRCFGSRNNSTNSNPFAGGLLLSRESSKVSFGLPEGFSVTAENGSSKVCFELLKTFRVTPKTLPPGCPSEVGQPIQTCGVPIPFLVLYAVQSYLVVKRGTPDAEQCRRQRAVAFCLFQGMDDLFLLHIV